MTEESHVNTKLAPSSSTTTSQDLPDSPRAGQSINLDQYNNGATSFDYDDADEALLDPDPDPSTTGTRRKRANTLTNISFDFTSNLLAIPVTQDVEQDHVEKHLGLINGIALVVGLQIGSGIFSSPGIVTADTGSVGASLLVWFGSGLLAWTGACSFTELGAAIPLNGGAQAYLQYSLGPVAAYLFSWTAIGALKPGSAAIIAIIFGEYMCRIFYHTAFSASSEESAQAIPLAVIKLVGVVAVLLVSILNIGSSKLVTRVQVGLTLAKILSLIAVAIIGIVTLARHEQSNALSGDIFRDSSTSPGTYALALYSGLWAYDGWDQTNYVAGEMKNVARDLPRVIHSSLVTVITLFLVTNVAYFIVLPKDVVSGSNTVGLDFGKSVLGPVGGVVFALIIAVSCLGSLNSSFYTSIRLIFTAAQEGFLHNRFATLHSTRKVPINALILQSALTSLFLVFGDFRSLVSFYGVCSWTWYFVTVVSLLALRVREPDLDRPYKTFLVTPVIFSCVALFLLLMPIFSAPFQAFLAFGYIALGIPAYYITKYFRDRQRDNFGQGLNDGNNSSKGFLHKLKSFIPSTRNNFGYRMFGVVTASRSTNDDDNDQSQGLMMSEQR